VERHMRVAETAELRTDTAELTRLRRQRHEFVRPAGNHVHLAGQTWDPKAVDDIRALERERHRPSDRETDLVRRHDGTVLASVAHTPPELFAVHDDPQIVLARFDR